MGKYTMELREIFTTAKFNPPLYTKAQVEGWFKDYQLSDYLTNEQISTITEAGIWTKDKLAEKIVNHYFMREIGQETIALFKHYAKVTMDELMEEYLPLIYSASIEYDPLINVNYSEQFYRSASVDSTGSSNSSGLGVLSDTPQGQISKTAILQGAYASSTNANENNELVNLNLQSMLAPRLEACRQFNELFGLTGTDKEIIEKLEPLFMGLY